MAIKESFKEAIKTGDIRGIRIVMKDSLLVDPTFHEFEEMERLAQKVHGLYDAHDGREFVSEQSSWNDDYMNKLMVQVVGNFSHERINHLKKVVRYLRPAPAHPQTAAGTGTYTANPQPEAQRSYQNQKRIDENDGRIVYNRGTKIVAGAIAGGAIGGAAATVVGGSVVVGVAAGAVIVGAVVTVAVNGDH